MWVVKCNVPFVDIHMYLTEPYGVAWSENQSEAHRFDSLSGATVERDRLRDDYYGDIWVSRLIPRSSSGKEVKP